MGGDGQAWEKKLDAYRFSVDQCRTAGERELIKEPFEP
jgi:hypothetical protein